MANNYKIFFQPAAESLPAVGGPFSGIDSAQTGAEGRKRLKTIIAL